MMIIGRMEDKDHSRKKWNRDAELKRYIVEVDEKQGRRPNQTEAVERKRR